MVVYSFEMASHISYAANSTVCLVADKQRATYEPLHRHDYYELVYIYDGAGVQIINDVSYSIGPGTVIFLHPDDTHSFYSNGSLSMINLCFIQTAGLYHLPERYSSNPVVVLSEQANDDIKLLFTLMESELKQQSHLSNAAIAYCLDWILLIFKRHADSHLPSDPLWGNLLTYISEHYATITLEEAAKIVRVSTSHFCRIFRRDFSMTFHAYVNNVRMQRAKYLLVYTDATIAEIAGDVGYTNSPCRFYQNFKASVGVTPSDYRKTCKSQLRNTMASS